MDVEEQTLKLLETKDGECPFDDWFASIRDERTRVIVRARLGRLRLGNFGDCGSSGQSIQHIKIDCGPGYRIYFTQIERVIVVLLCGGNKSSQNKDVKKAHKLWEEIKKMLKDFKETYAYELRSPHFASMYLEESLNLDIPTFLLALRDVIDANRGTFEASASHVTLTECGATEFQALQMALSSIGMRFSITQAEAQIAPAETAKAA